MMHGHEKSDPDIVAMKPANKAAQPRRSWWSEGQGPRGTRTSKTRPGAGPGGVTQALDRVRQAARQRKKERFTALLHHVNPETLRVAFNASKRTRPPAWTGRPGRTTR